MKKLTLVIAAAALALGVGLGIGYGSSARSSDVTASAPQSPIEAPPPRAAGVPVPAAVPDLRAAASAVPTAHASDRRLTEGSGRGTPANPEHLERADRSDYSVQVAAVPALEEARVLLEQLSGARYPAYLIPVTINQVRLYRVRVGPFKSQQTAQKTARRLEREGHHAPWITK